MCWCSLIWEHEKEHTGYTLYLLNIYEKLVLIKNTHIPTQHFFHTCALEGVVCLLCRVVVAKGGRHQWKEATNKHKFSCQKHCRQNSNIKGQMNVCICLPSGVICLIYVSYNFAWCKAGVANKVQNGPTHLFWDHRGSAPCSCNTLLFVYLLYIFAKGCIDSGGGGGVLMKRPSSRIVIKCETNPSFHFHFGIISIN